MSDGPGDDGDLLDRVLGPRPPCFALLYRPEATGRRIEVLTGDVTAVPRLADLPIPPAGTVVGAPRHELLTLVPYRQLAERGFRCHDDQAPLLALTVRAQRSYAFDEALPRLPDAPITVTGGRFDIDDEEYAELVRTVLAEEIGRGAGSNFVIKRSFIAEVPGFSPRDAISLFHRLVTGERGAYWTFVVHTGERTFVGATPERHVSLFDGNAVMNPISGTLRYPPTGPRLSDVLEFLADPKEAAELLMVVDEELKMMGRLTAHGSRVAGPYLKEMANLAHTEYLIEGHTTRDVREILRETMFAPTVTGSPLESACRVIHDHEPRGRGYYGGVAALVSRDIKGAQSLDSAILLRTAQFAGDRLEIGVGATLVRDSQPSSEVAETRAKSRGVLRALGIEEGPAVATAGPPADLSGNSAVISALAARNRWLSSFWLDRSSGTGTGTGTGTSTGTGRADRPRAMIVDAEDAFTAMLGHQLGFLGFTVDIVSCWDADPRDRYDLVVMGPGPGDPRDTGDPRIGRVRDLLAELVGGPTPLLAVCLSHQVLGGLLGLDLIRRARPNQGVAHEIDYFGRRARLGFYNSFALTCDADELVCEGVGPVRVSRDRRTAQVHGLAGPGFRSMQFHPESVLSRDGVAVLRDAIGALRRSPHTTTAAPRTRTDLTEHLA